MTAVRRQYLLHHGRRTRRCGGRRARLQDPKHAVPQIMRHLKAELRHAMRQSVRID
jgi:hypothetical protein